MKKIISKTITLTTTDLPPTNDFIEQELKKQGIDPLRWAIIEVINNTLTICASGEEI